MRHPQKYNRGLVYVFSFVVGEDNHVPMSIILIT